MMFQVRQCRALRSSIRSIHVAIVGTGPSAFYSAKYLLDKNKDVHVDMIEKLPIPFGLVRYGVAPDHPEVKSVITQFEELFTQHSRLRYFGNLTLGEADAPGTVSLKTLQQHYAGVILAYGASSDNVLNIDGNEHRGVFSARQFVNWYNGHPDFEHFGENFNLSNIKEVVIIGQGNVAIDCARLLSMKYEDIYNTDVSPIALEAFRTSTVERVTILGRRGHVQASFTIKELRELTRLDGVQLRMFRDELDAGLTEASKVEIQENRPKKRIVELMQTVACSDSPLSLPPQATGRTLDIRYLRSPQSFVSDEQGSVQAVVVGVNRLLGEAHAQHVAATGASETLPCQLVLQSIGYKSLPVPGAALPFCNKSNIIPSARGRITHDSVPLPGLYVTGWLKRGPTGIIGSNIGDAKETVQAVLEDLSTSTSTSTSDPIHAIEQMRDKTIVSWADYLAIDAEEVKRGQVCTPPRIRVKMVSHDATMKFVQSLR